MLWQVLLQVVLQPVHMHQAWADRIIGVLGLLQADRYSPYSGLTRAHRLKYRVQENRVLQD